MLSRQANPANLAALHWVLSTGNIVTAIGSVVLHATPIAYGTLRVMSRPSTVEVSSAPSASAMRRSARSRLSDPRETARATRHASLVPDARFCASMTWINAAPAIVVTVSATSSSTSVSPWRPSERGVTGYRTG